MRCAPATKLRGFTLIELMVAMSAGLIVAMAVVGLSHEASNTFHEETRVAATEMQLRTAIDRLRADLGRASFMSTGNIYIDPSVLTTAGTTTNVNAGAWTATSLNAAHMSLFNLAGIRLFPGGSNLASTMPLSGYNFGTAANMGPDAIELAGNMTGVEILSVGAPAGVGFTAVMPGTVCSTQRIYLDVLSTPAIWRLVGMSPTGSDAAYDTALLNAFEPVNTVNNNNVGASFIVRIVDNNTGKVQYAATCPANKGVSWNMQGGVPMPYVELDQNSHIVVTGVQQSLTINPVHIVRWALQPSLINPPPPATPDVTKYDLTRQFVDAYGNLAGTPEVIAEYAADMKFAFTVDTLGNTVGTYPGNSPLVVNSFEDFTAGTAAIAGDVSGSTSSGGAIPNGPYPQRIRSVRFRLATRSATQDRTEPLDAGSPYLYRYALAVGSTTSFARTRTLISEVSLPNQARLWFQ